MERAEVVKAIETGVEKMLEDFSEALQYLRSEGADECDEMQNLLFASRRIIELTDSSLGIYHSLIRLKYLGAGMQSPDGEERHAGAGFWRLFDGLRQGE